jgi:hypothetical protein
MFHLKYFLQYSLIVILSTVISVIKSKDEQITDWIARAFQSSLVRPICAKPKNLMQASGGVELSARMDVV